MAIRQHGAGVETGSVKAGQKRRRHFFMAWVIVVMAALACRPGTALHAETGADSRQVQIEWQVPVPQLAKVEQHLDFTGRQIPVQTSDRSPPLFIILAGLVSLPYLADAIVSVYHDTVFGGVIINVCDDKLEIRNDHALPGEVLVVIRCKDAVEIYRSKDVTSSDLVKAIVKAIVEAGTKAK